MREFRTSGSVGAPGERSPGATRRRIESPPERFAQSVGRRDATLLGEHWEMTVAAGGFDAGRVTRVRGPGP